MTAEDKKKREAFFLREFIERTPEFRDLAIEPAESPDFILRSKTGTPVTVGVELTDYFQGEKGPAGSEDRKAEVICQSIRNRLTAIHRDPIQRDEFDRRHGILEFIEHGVHLPKGDLEKLAAELISVIRLTPEERERVVEGLMRTEFPTVFKHLSDVQVSENRAWLETIWVCLECMGGWVGVTEAELRSVLEGKIGLAAAYREKRTFTTLVLLIVAAGESISTAAAIGTRMDELALALRPLMAELGFDRIYFYCRDDDDVFRLF